MLTKGQKIIMYLSGLFVFLIGIITFIPFRTVPFLNNIDNIINSELIIKLIVFPIVIIALSVYPNILKYEQIDDCRERSKVVNTLSYLPVVVYICALMVFILHTLSYSPDPLDTGLWAIVFIVLTCYLAFLVAIFHRINNIIIRLNKVGTIILDCGAGVMLICFALAAWRISVSYALIYSSANDFFAGDPFIFYLLIGTVIVMICVLRGLRRLVTIDQADVYVNPLEAADNYDNVVKAEYTRAYNDILDDFEAYFDEHFSENEEKVAPHEEAPSPEEAPEVPTEEEVTPEVPTEEAPEVPVEEAPAPEEAAPEVPVEEAPEVPTEEAPAPEEVAPEALPVQEEVVTETVEVESKEPKILVPSYEKVVAYASLVVDNVTVTHNDTETQHKFFIDKKMFLVTQKTSNDYRIAFLASTKDMLRYINKYPKVIIKPTSPKGDNWLQLINKNEFDEKLIKKMISNAVVTLEELEAEKVAAKEKEKQRKAEEKAKAKAKAKAKKK